MGKQRKVKEKTRRDVAETARSIVERIIGERPTGEPLPQPEQSDEPDTRNPAAASLSKLGASEGGKARAASLSAEQRKKIAKKAALTRWETREQ
jgi:hypothetical protein